MANIQIKINFGNESLESLIDELIKEKIKEVTYRLKNEGFKGYNQNKNCPSTNNLREKADGIK